MTKRNRKSDEWQLALSYDAETHAQEVHPMPVPGAPASAFSFGEPEIPVTDAVVDAFLGTQPEQADPERTERIRELFDEKLLAKNDGEREAAQVVDITPTILEEFVDEETPAPRMVIESRVDSVDGKPPYRIPLMTEIRQRPKNGLNMVSTFSGCGGSCLGFKMAGYNVLWANEFVPAAQDTYRANHDGTFLSTDDIRKVSGADIRKVIGDIDIDVLEGSPPCASFSTAGKGSKGWGQVRKYSDVEQRTDDLFDQFIRLIEELNPRSFVAENVAGMVKGVAKGFFLRYLRKMRKLPYNVEARLLDAQYLGVPQRRVRLIFVGVRKDVGRPKYPHKLPYTYSIREAIPWIGKAVHDEGGEWSQGDVTNKAAPTIRSSSVGRMFVDSEAFVEDRMGAYTEAGKSTLKDKTLPVSLDGPLPTVRQGSPDQFRVVVGKRIAQGEVVDENVGASLDGYRIGEAWDKLKPGEQDEKYQSLQRADAEAPCPTVTANGASAGSIGAPGSVAAVTHPFERRKFSIAELRRICGFPDDFVFTGNYAQQWERMGRAVPPPMMAAVAAALAPVLLQQCDGDGGGVFCSSIKKEE